MKRPFAPFAAALVGLVITALGACASAGAGVCDPITIHVDGKCYWDQPSACDAANCNAPNKCTIVEDKPAHVECERVDQPAK